MCNQSTSKVTSNGRHGLQTDNFKHTEISQKLDVWICISEKEALLSSLKALFKKYKLTLQHEYASESEMETDQPINDMTENGNQGEADDSRNHGDNLPLTFVPLWPVFEYLWTTESMDILRSWLQGELNLDRLMDFINYGSQFTAIAPVDMLTYKSLTDNDQVCIDTMYLKYHLSFQAATFLFEL